MKRLLIAAVCFAAAALAQDGPLDPQDSWTKLNYYNVGNYIIYQCFARTTGAVTTLPTPSAASNASPVSITSTGHGFDTTQTPKVTISGATSGWASLNGTFTATVTGANTFTVPVDSGAFGTFTGQTLTVTTLSPRTTQAVWAVKQINYDGSNNATSLLWANGKNSQVNACANRATLSYQ